MPDYNNIYADSYHTGYEVSGLTRYLANMSTVEAVGWAVVGAGAIFTVGYIAAPAILPILKGFAAGGVLYAAGTGIKAGGDALGPQSDLGRWMHGWGTGVQAAGIGMAVAPVFSAVAAGSAVAGALTTAAGIGMVTYGGVSIAANWPSMSGQQKSDVLMSALGMVAGGITARSWSHRASVSVRHSAAARQWGSLGKGTQTQQMPGGRSPWTGPSALDAVTGKTGAVRNQAIEAIIKEDLPNLRLTYKPRYSPYASHGVARRGFGTQIGRESFSTRASLRDTIIHEELHHRWWGRGKIGPHHSSEYVPNERFYEVIRRYKRMRGWDS